MSVSDLCFALLRHSKSLPVFNRCTPLDISCYTKFAEVLITFVSDNSVMHGLIAGVMASKEIILGLCLLALGKALSTSCSYGVYTVTEFMIYSLNILFSCIKSSAAVAYPRRGLMCLQRCSSAYNCCNAWSFALPSPSCQLRPVRPFDLSCYQCVSARRTAAHWMLLCFSHHSLQTVETSA